MKPKTKKLLKIMFRVFLVILAILIAVSIMVIDQVLKITLIPNYNITKTLGI